MIEYDECIIKTLAFFDVLAMPLRLEEVGHYLYRPHSPAVDAGVIEKELRELERRGVIKFHQDHFFLADRSPDMVKARLDAKQRSLAMLDQARPWLSFLAGWPDVRALAVCNSLGWLNANEESDLDLFVITTEGKLWQTRFALASLLHVSGMRPRPGDEYGKMCLSFLVAENALDFGPLFIDEDVYFAYWFSSLRPFYDPDGLLRRLAHVNQSLVSATIGERVFFQEPDEQIIDRRWFGRGRGMGKMVSAISDEKRLRRFQEKRFPPAIRNAARSGSDVVLSDSLLKLHVNDRRRFYRDAWKERARQLL